MTNKHSIIIVGAGFGGLRAALFIGRKIKKLKLQEKYGVTLIDRNAYHTYTPTLYEIAATSNETADYLDLKQIVTFPIEKIISDLPIRFLHGEITQLDLMNGDIHCLCAAPSSRQEELKFDYLVLALGSEINYFDIKGLKENSFILKGFLDAIKIRDKIWELITSGKEIVRIVIGGGGSTGVELSGELKEWLCEMKEEVKGMKCAAQITIIEGASTVLSVFTPTIIKRAQKRLSKLGIEVVVNETISNVSPGKISLKSGKEISYDVLVWTGGVKAASLVGTLPLKLEKRGRVEVVGEMECLPQSPDLKLYGKIYGIGDAVCFYDPVSGKPIPGVARAAISQANVAAKNIIADIMAKENITRNVKRYVYKPMAYPYVIPIGGKYAIAKIGPFVISGLLGWILKGLVELNYLISIIPFGKALKIWLKGLKIFVKNDRLG